MAEQHRYRCSYISDDGNTYNVILGANRAGLGAFGPSQPGQSGLPRGYKMRQIHGRTADNQRSYSFPFFSPTDAAFADIDGQEFEYDGETFIITGATGEKRSLGPEPLP